MMKRRDLLEKSGPVTLGAALMLLRAEGAQGSPAAGKRGRVIGSAMGPTHSAATEPKAQCWVNGQRVGTVVAITNSIARAEQGDLHHPKPVDAAGTLVLIEPDWDALEEQQPLMGTVRKLQVRVEIPRGVRRPGGPRTVLLEGCQLTNCGFGWTEDDLSEEVAFHWLADNLRLEGKI
jgi:hypothetical protein